MLEFLRTNQFLVGALTGSLAAFLLGLLVSYLRREKRWLGYSTGSRNIVQRGHSKLAMKYDGRDIGRLDSHTVILRNIGNRPLLNLPIKIECVEGGEVVEYELQGPEGATCAAIPDGAGRLVVTTDLLNPGEVTTVGLTVADSKAGELRVIARGEFLEVKEIGQQASTVELLEILMPRISFGGLLSDLYRVFRSKRL